MCRNVWQKFKQIHKVKFYPRKTADIEYMGAGQYMKSICHHTIMQIELKI